MIQEVLDALYGNNEDDSLYNASYRYMVRDFEDLLNYGKNGYNPEILIEIIKKERTRLKNQYYLYKVLKSADGLFNTDIEKFRKYSEMYREAIRYYRYASIRDKGVIRQKKEIERFKKELKEKFFKYRNFGRGKDNTCIFHPETLAKICSELTGIDDEDITYLHNEIIEFIRICPESYLKKGIFAKYIGSLFGVMKFNYKDPDIDYHQKILLGSCFGITYLFDEIIDDHAYSIEEKKEYYRVISQILKSGKGDETEFSKDPLMAFTENTLIKIRETLSEKRWNMLAKSYSVIADASVKGAGWKYCHSLSDEDLYINAALKGSYTRIIPAILADCNITGNFLTHSLRSGYIFQLPDDLRDIPDDIKNENVTAFNYYPDGVSRLNYHPINILLMAISRISYVDYPEMKDACPLYMISIFQSLKALYIKNNGEDLCNFFMNMNFPDETIIEHLCQTGRYCTMITDFETEIAGKCTLISLDMKKSLK